MNSLEGRQRLFEWHMLPNKSLQLTGHATNGFSWRHAASRVSRQLSWVFGGEAPR